MFELHLYSLENSLALGRVLARCVQEDELLRCILLRGELGSGKTSLVRFLVEALPGGVEAEVSSPSFTLCNSYPVNPPILHCDLYRTAGALPEELDEALDTGRELCLVEWAEYLPPALLPKDFLDIKICLCDICRIVQIRRHGGHGQNSMELFASLCADFKLTVVDKI